MQVSLQSTLEQSAHSARHWKKNALLIDMIQYYCVLVVMNKNHTLDNYKLLSIRELISLTASQSAADAK
jgi:hypothetical protein